MTPAPPRVLVAAFCLEANTFAAGATTLADFRAQVLQVGDDATPSTLGPQSELHAAWTTLAAQGCEVVPSVVAWSAPRRPLTGEALQELIALATSRCDDSIAGAYVMLHGSAVAHGDDDPEGTLLAALRDRLGAGVPIAISLDCHAHLTEAMVDAVDIVTAYRTCPHIDTARTGEQAARLLHAAVLGETRPVVAMAARPMVTAPGLHDNDREPFRTLMRRCGEREQGPVLAAGILMVQPWIDVPGLSWKAVVTADGDRALARAAATELIDEAWARRRELVPPAGPQVDDALAQALALRSPATVADAGDATNGGSIGDSTELLRAALRRDGPGSVLLSVADPAAAQLAFSAGPGARVEVALGTGPEGAYNERVVVSGVVGTVFDGAFAYTHPAYAGYRASTGAAALLRVGPTDVVVHSRSVGVIDPAIYEALGADVAAYDVIQAKSHVSHRAGFARITPRTVVAATPGPTTAELTRLDYVRRPRPMFPFELS